MEKKTQKRKSMRLSKAEKERRAENMRQVSAKRNEAYQLKAEEKALDDGDQLSVTEKRFADLYVWGDGDFLGRPGACYTQVFGQEDASEAGRYGRKMLKKPKVSHYIDKQVEEFETLLKAEKMKNISTLVKIRDEMSSAEYKNRFGEINGTAACRSVAIKAAETVNNMLGFDKPKEININHGANGETGVVFNLIAPPTLSE